MPNTINEENILIQAGLSEDQAQVYDYLLDKGPQKASSISSWTGVKRGLTYKILEQLEIMGLVEKKGGEGTVATFYPQHPSLLMHTLEGKEKELALAKEMLTYSLGSLSSKYNLITGKPSVQFFEGTEAVRKITGDYPTTDKEIRQIIDISEFIKAIPSETEGYRNERIKKGIKKRMLLPATQSNTDYADKSTEMTEFGFLKNISEIEAAIQIYDERVTMLKVNSDTKIGVLIEDKDIANTMKKVFDALWEKSK